MNPIELIHSPHSQYCNFHIQKKQSVKKNNVTTLYHKGNICDKFAYL